MNLNFDEKIMSSRYKICSLNSRVLIYQQETRINRRAFGNLARHESEQKELSGLARVAIKEPANHL